MRIKNKPLISYAGSATETSVHSIPFGNESQYKNNLFQGFFQLYFRPIRLKNDVYY